MLLVEIYGESTPRAGRRRQDWCTSLVATRWLSDIAFSAVRAGDLCVTTLRHACCDVGAQKDWSLSFIAHAVFDLDAHTWWLRKRGLVSLPRRYAQTRMGTMKTNPARIGEDEEGNFRPFDDSSEQNQCCPLLELCFHFSLHR